MLSRKETIAIILMLTSLICILNAAVFGNILPPYISYEQVTHQVISIGTAYICLLYALSTWMYHSNYSRPRHHMRIVLVSMVLIMLLANAVGLVLHVKSLGMVNLKSSTDINDLFSRFDVASKSVTMALSIITIVLLFLVALIVCVTIMSKHGKKQRRKSRESQARNATPDLRSSFQS